MIEKWIVPISGFTQSIAAPNGFDRLWKKLRMLSGPKTSVITPQRWRANFDYWAEFIFRHSQPNGDGGEAKPPKIIVAAYSWGCGHGALSLFRQLAKRGLSVDHAVLCDPVYHSWMRPWRALIFSPQIVIPPNVREVHWLRQKNNRPRATWLEAADDGDAETIIHPPVEVVDREHAYMDDDPRFHRMVMEVAQR